jgi:MSHA pilin protein MshB
MQMLAAPRASGRAHIGYTLIELVTTMVIIAILAAAALPRFVDISSSAHQASVAATAAQLQGAITLANIGCQVANFAAQDNLATFGDGDLDFNEYCYPTSTSGHNGNVNPTRCVELWNGLLSIAPSIGVSPNGATDYSARGQGTVCTYAYQRDADTARSIRYDSATGTVDVVNP